MIVVCLFVPRGGLCGHRRTECVASVAQHRRSCGSLVFTPLMFSFFWSTMATWKQGRTYKRGVLLFFVKFWLVPSPTSFVRGGIYKGYVSKQLQRRVRRKQGYIFNALLSIPLCLPTLVCVLVCGTQHLGVRFGLATVLTYTAVHWPDSKAACLYPGFALFRFLWPVLPYKHTYALSPWGVAWWPTCRCLSAEYVAYNFFGVFDGNKPFCVIRM